MTARSWVPVKSLHEPFNDAYNYRSRGEKEFFNKLFLRTDHLKECLAPQKYFLMGEKGSGKTAYAVYLENNDVDKNKCQITTMTETQYKRFIELKRAGKLQYSDYSNIWRSILLFLCSNLIVKKSKGIFSTITGKFDALEKEIERWSSSALNPEVESAFEAICSDEFGMELGNNKFGKISGEEKEQRTENSAKLRHHLLETENAMKQVISSLSLRNNHVLFIDGVDYRPEGISYKEYINCIKGLAEAVWQLNTDFFNSIRDSKGRVKIVLLVRPDIFHSLNLYNSNSRLHDNTVYLNWATTTQEYENSNLYEVSGRFFSQQQSFKVSPQDAWEHYVNDNTRGHTFKRLLRQSFQRPRDILTFVKIAQETTKSGRSPERKSFEEDIISNSRLKRDFSDYLLGEARNYASFYMTQEDFRFYLKFFQYLNGKPRFNFREFSEAFDRFVAWSKGERFKAKEYLKDAESLLQFFYDLNIIGYSDSAEVDGERYFHWSFRERSLNDIAPKVKSDGVLMINSGIAKALDIGKEFKKKANEVNHRQREPNGRKRKKPRKSNRSNRKPEVNSQPRRRRSREVTAT